MPIAKAGHTIASLADWERLAPPKSQSHWVDNRSAKEVARAWLEGRGETLPPEVHSALAEHPMLGPVPSWEAAPEVRLHFDAFPGEPRNSDLVVLARDSFGSYLLTVEAKADEPYGETVAEAFAAALERRIDNSRSKGIARIEGLASSLLRPRRPDRTGADQLRYQLLTACAGTVAEAIRRGYTRAVMLVHEFITPITANKNHERNALDLYRFLGRLGDDAVGPISKGRLYGPFPLQAAGEIQLFVGKFSRNLRNAMPDSPQP
jgi:hypothetical protein